MSDRNQDAGFGSHCDFEQTEPVDLLDLIAKERDDAIQITNVTSRGEGTIIHI